MYIHSLVSFIDSVDTYKHVSRKFQIFVDECYIKLLWLFYVFHFTRPKYLERRFNLEKKMQDEEDITKSKVTKSQSFRR